MLPIRKLLIIILLTAASIFVALPDELPIKFQYQDFKIDYTLKRPDISFQIGEFAYTKNLETHLGLDLAGGSHLVFEADVENLFGDDQKAALEGTRDAIERRVNLFGVAESTVQTSKVGGSSRIVVELPGVKDTQAAIALIGQTARLDFRELAISPSPEATTEPIFITLENTKSTGFTGADFQRARADFDPQTGKPMISFETKPAGAAKFADITTRLTGRRLIIFLDEIPISDPVVNSPITGGSGVIQGEFALEEAKNLANLLNAGALPVPIKLIEQRTVEASLGEESVKSSVYAGLVGLAMVIVFMTVYYGRLGVVATVGLLIYGVITLALYKLIPVVLTLPGIAGFILSVGMAVDSNILIFERLKEETRLGKPWLDSMEHAFGRAWDSIRDANIATLLTAFILFNPLNLEFLHTSGPIRGFAATLFLGVLVSLFTGLFVTRTLLRTFARSKQT